VTLKNRTDTHLAFRLVRDLDQNHQTSSPPLRPYLSRLFHSENNNLSLILALLLCDYVYSAMGEEKSIMRKELVTHAVDQGREVLAYLMRLWHARSTPKLV